MFESNCLCLTQPAPRCSIILFRGKQLGKSKKLILTLGKLIKKELTKYLQNVRFFIYKAPNKTRRKGFLIGRENKFSS